MLQGGGAGGKLRALAVPSRGPMYQDWKFQKWK